MPRKRQLDPRPIYYVYVLFDWLAVPRWVGKGKGNRIDDHGKTTDRSNQPKNEFIEQTWIMLEEIPKLKIHEDINEAIALIYEGELIKAIGRVDNGTGPLLNRTDGGEGLSGHSFSLWTRALLAENAVHRMSKYTAEQKMNFARPGGKVAGLNLWANNGETNRRFKPGLLLPDGWVKGRLHETPIEFQRAAVNTIWIHDGIKSKRWKIEKSIPQGWELGRKPKIIDPPNYCNCGCNKEIGKGSTWHVGHYPRKSIG